MSLPLFLKGASDDAGLGGVHGRAPLAHPPPGGLLACEECSGDRSLCRCGCLVPTVFTRGGMHGFGIGLTSRIRDIASMGEVAEGDRATHRAGGACYMSLPSFPLPWVRCTTLRACLVASPGVIS